MMAAMLLRPAMLPQPVVAAAEVPVLLVRTGSLALAVPAALERPPALQAHL
jgi:hypothetical protein